MKRSKEDMDKDSHEKSCISPNLSEQRIFNF